MYPAMFQGAVSKRRRYHIPSDLKMGSDRHDKSPPVNHFPQHTSFSTPADSAQWLNPF